MKKKKSIHHWSFAINVDFLLKMRPANLQMQPVKTSLMTWLLTSWMNGWMLPGRKRLVILIAGNDRRWEVMGAVTWPSCSECSATWPCIYRVVNDNKDAEMLRKKQQKSIQYCISVSVSLPPHRCETVHNADATRKFGSEDAIQSSQHGRETKQNQVLHVEELNQGQGEAAWGRGKKSKYTNKSIWK